MATDEWNEDSDDATDYEEIALPLDASGVDRPTWRELLRRRGARILFGASFLIPFVLIFGPLAWWEARDSGGDHQQDEPTAAAVPFTPAPASTSWPSGVDFTLYSVPAMIKNELVVAGERHGYRFEGQPGAFWRITVDPQPGSAADPQITLYAPSGEIVAENDNRAESDPAAEIVITLPEAGAYGLLVTSGQGGITSGEYLLSVFEN